MKYPPLMLLALAACALPCTAQAQGQLAITAKTVNVRAGPASDYPIVVVLPAGYQLGVQGCLPDYAWCDVIAGPSRGWVYGGNISYAYQNTYVPVLNYGAIIGIGVLAFTLDDYWGHHYRHRPFYGERHRWSDRSPPRQRFDGRSPPGPRFDGRPAPGPRFEGRPGPGQRFDGRPGPGFNGQPPRSGGPDQRPQRLRGGAPRGPDSNPSGAVLPGAQPAAPQPGTARPPRSQQRQGRQQQEGPPQGGGSGWSPRDARGPGRLPDQ